MDKELFLMPTTEFVPYLVANGACLCLPAPVLPVPIPLIDVRINNNRQVIWATIQTPFGSQNPCFGHFTYASQNRVDGGSEFFGSKKEPIVAILDVGGFGFPDYTVEKLRDKARTHAEEMRDDMSYRMLWDSYYANYIMGNGV